MLEVLIVEDDGIGREALTAWMEQQGVKCRAAASVAEARQALSEQQFDLTLLDIQLPDASGMDLLEELRGTPSDIIVISGHSTVDDAIQALRAGAVDFLPKPIDMTRLHVLLKNQQERLALRGQVKDLRDKLRGLGRYGEMVGSSSPMQRVYECIARVAPTNETVLIMGQSGTGKEVAAATIHQHSRRHSKPFVAINCGAISPTLIESEFFGHERGSFTGADRRRKGVFEQADGGTLFLDEITEMPLDLQVRLLRVLETQKVTRVGGQEEVPVDVRIIAATNRVPQQAVADGKLRHDLLYRLLVFPIQIPPLKERGQDIDLLADFFLAKLNEEYSTDKKLSAEARHRLHLHDWPGNVRELGNTIRRAFIMAQGDVETSHLMLSGIPDGVSADEHAAHDGMGAADGLNLSTDRAVPGHNGKALVMHPGMSIAAAEQMLIEATLVQVNGNKKVAAEQLGISVKTLYSRLQVYAAMSQGRSVPLPPVDVANDR